MEIEKDSPTTKQTNSKEQNRVESMAEAEAQITMLRLKLKLFKKESEEQYEELSTKYEASQLTVRTLVQINRTFQQELNEGIDSFSPTYPHSPRAMTSPRVSELTNSLANLKWGFKRRESDLLSQIDKYETSTRQLHTSQCRLKMTLRSLCEKLCDNLVHADVVVEEDAQRTIDNDPEGHLVDGLKKRITQLENKNSELLLLSLDYHKSEEMKTHEKINENKHEKLSEEMKMKNKEIHDLTVRIREVEEENELLQGDVTKYKSKISDMKSEMQRDLSNDISEVIHVIRSNSPVRSNSNSPKRSTSPIRIHSPVRERGESNNNNENQNDDDNKKNDMKSKLNNKKALNAKNQNIDNNENKQRDTDNNKKYDNTEYNDSKDKKENKENRESKEVSFLQHQLQVSQQALQQLLINNSDLTLEKEILKQEIHTIKSQEAIFEEDRKKMIEKSYLQEQLSKKMLSIIENQEKNIIYKDENIHLKKDITLLKTELSILREKDSVHENNKIENHNKFCMMSDYAEILKTKVALLENFVGNIENMTGEHFDGELTHFSGEISGFSGIGGGYGGDMIEGEEGEAGDKQESSDIDDVDAKNVDDNDDITDNMDVNNTDNNNNNNNNDSERIVEEYGNYPVTEEFQHTNVWHNDPSLLGSGGRRSSEKREKTSEKSEKSEKSERNGVEGGNGGNERGFTPVRLFATYNSNDNSDNNDNSGIDNITNSTNNDGTIPRTPRKDDHEIIKLVGSLSPLVLTPRKKNIITSSEKSKLSSTRNHDSSDSLNSLGRGANIAANGGGNFGGIGGGIGGVSGGFHSGVGDSGSRLSLSTEYQGLSNLKTELDEQLKNLMSKKREYEDINNSLLGNYQTRGGDRGDRGDSSIDNGNSDYDRVGSKRDRDNNIANNPVYSPRKEDNGSSSPKNHKKEGKEGREGREGRVNPFSNNKGINKGITGSNSPKNDTNSPKIGSNSPKNDTNSPKNDTYSPNPSDFSTSPGKSPHRSPKKLHLDLSKVVSPDTNITPNIIPNVIPNVMSPAVAKSGTLSKNTNSFPNDDNSIYEGVNPMYKNISPRNISPRNSHFAHISDDFDKDSTFSPHASPVFLERKKSISETLVMRSPGKKQENKEIKNIKDSDISDSSDSGNNGSNGNNSGNNSSNSNEKEIQKEKEKEKEELAEIIKEKKRIIDDLKELNKLKINMLREVHLIQSKLKSGLTENRGNRENRQSVSPKSLLPPNLNNTKNLHLNNAKMIKMAENAKKDKHQINELLTALKITKNAVDSSYSNLQKTQEKMFEFFNKSEALKDENEKLKKTFREFLSGNNNNNVINEFLATYSNI